MTDLPLLTIGKITGAHGLGGNLKVWSFAESPDTFAPGMQVRLKPEKTDPGDNGLKSFTITGSSVRKKGILLKLDTVDTRDAAEALIGCKICINREELPQLEADTWYWQDLYGLDVEDDTLGYLGKIQTIFPTGANDILVIRHPETGQETLVPMHRHFIDSVDLKEKQVKTTLPEGY